MVVASRTPCQACTHDGGGRVLDTQPSAGTLDTNIDLRLPAGTAARAKRKHPRSARAGSDRHTRHRRQMLHESAPHAFAMQSNPSNCSWCNTQKLEFYIPCCSTCHALPRSHMNLDIAPHKLFIQGILMCASFQTPTTHWTRFTLISTPCAPPTMFKAAGTDVECHQRHSGEEHAVLITSVALRESASALAPRSPILLPPRPSSMTATLAWF